MQYYDVETKMWKSLAASTTPKLKTEAKAFLSADLVGSKLFVVTDYFIYAYDTGKKVWENIPHSLPRGAVSELRTIGDYMYAISTTLNSSHVPQRYNFVKRRWQRYAKVMIPSSENESSSFHNSGATVFHSKVYVLYGRRSKSENSWRIQTAVLFYFDPVENEWERKASTCRPHFGSTLFLMNGRLHVAGGNVKFHERYHFPYGDSAPVEVYDEQNNSWSVVKQEDHIPPSDLGAVEIEGRVYFIINRFPIDSGIRIPPGEKYHVDLDDWENLGKVNSGSVLCYLPANRENMNTE